MVAEIYSPIHKETRLAGRPTTGTPATRNNNRPDLFVDLEWFVFLEQIEMSGSFFISELPPT